MISYIRGILTEASGDGIVVEAGGIGYEIRVPLSVLERLPRLGEEVKIHTFLQVREDGVGLFGFLDRGGLAGFKQLLGVGGIGPKGALGVLTALKPDDLRLAVISGDAKAIARAPGVGIKTAQRIILDLKDKVSMDDILPAADGSGPDSGGRGDAVLGAAAREAMEALTALGYSAMEASRAVGRVEVTGDMTAEDVLKQSLRFLI